MARLSLLPPRLDIYQFRESNLNESFAIVNADGTPFDLTGYAAELALYLQSNQVPPSPVDTLTTTNGRIVLGGADGVLQLLNPEATVAAYEFTQAYYYLRLTKAGSVLPLASGQFTVTDAPPPSVTQPNIGTLQIVLQDLTLTPTGVPGSVGPTGPTGPAGNNAPIPRKYTSLTTGLVYALGVAPDQSKPMCLFMGGTLQVDTSYSVSGTVLTISNAFTPYLADLGNLAFTFFTVA